MTDKLKRAIEHAMSALREIDSILDSGDPADVGDIDDNDEEKLLDLSDLAGSVATHAVTYLFQQGD